MYSIFKFFVFGLYIISEALIFGLPTKANDTTGYCCPRQRATPEEQMRSVPFGDNTYFMSIILLINDVINICTITTF